MKFTDGKRGDYVVMMPMRDLYRLFREAIEHHEMPKSDKDAVTQNFCVSVEKSLHVYPNVVDRGDGRWNDK